MKFYAHPFSQYVAQHAAHVVIAVAVVVSPWAAASHAKVEHSTFNGKATVGLTTSADVVYVLGADGSCHATDIWHLDGDVVVSGPNDPHCGTTPNVTVYNPADGFCYSAPRADVNGLEVVSPTDPRCHY